MKRNPDKAPNAPLLHTRLPASPAEFFDVREQVRLRGGGLRELIDEIDERRHSQDEPVRARGESQEDFVRRKRRYYQKRAIYKRRCRTRREVALEQWHLEAARRIHEAYSSWSKQRVARLVEKWFKRDGRTLRQMTLDRQEAARRIHAAHPSWSKQRVAREVEKRDGLSVSYRTVEMEIDREGGLESLTNSPI